MKEKGRGSIFGFLVNINPIAKLYKNLLGAPDLLALSLADDDKGREPSQAEIPQTQIEDVPETTVSQEPIKLSANQKYGDANHARRYGDYEAAHEIEKEMRRKWKND